MSKAHRRRPESAPCGPELEQAGQPRNSERDPVPKWDVDIHASTLIQWGAEEPNFSG